MRKSTLVKYILIIGGLSAWTYFCMTKIPEYQKANREVAMREYISLCNEYEKNYIDIVDSEGNIHTVPRDQYEAEQLRWKQIELEQYYAIPTITEIATITSPAVTKSVEPTPTAISTMAPEDPYERYTEFSKDYSDSDIKLLAQLIESEAGIESYQCKLCVASVVLNRCASEDFPGSLQEVIFQRTSGDVAQFSVTIVRSDGTRAIDCEPSKDSWKAARNILENGSILPLDVQFFYSTSCKSNWLFTRETYDVIDHTIFAYRWRKQ